MQLPWYLVTAMEADKPGASLICENRILHHSDPGRYAFSFASRAYKYLLFRGQCVAVTMGSPRVFLLLCLARLCLCTIFTAPEQLASIKYDFIVVGGEPGLCLFSF
jgi:hypothetical protein